MSDPPRTPKAASFSGGDGWRYMVGQPSASSSSFSNHTPSQAPPLDITTRTTASPSEVFGTAATASLSSTPTPFGLAGTFNLPIFAGPAYDSQVQSQRNNSFDSYFPPTLAGTSGVPLSPSLSASPGQFVIDQLKTPLARHFAAFPSSTFGQASQTSGTMPGMSPYLGLKSPMPFPVTPPPQATFSTSGTMIVAEPHIVQPSQHPSTAMSVDGDDFMDVTPPKTQPIMRTSVLDNGSLRAADSIPPLWTRRPLADARDRRGPASAAGLALPPALTPATVLASGAFGAPPPPPAQAQFDERVTSSVSPVMSTGARAGAGDNGDPSQIVPGSSPTPVTVPHLSCEQGSARSPSASVTPTPFATHVDSVTNHHANHFDNDCSTIPAPLCPSEHTPIPASSLAPVHSADPLPKDRADSPACVPSTSVTIPGAVASSLPNLTTNTPLSLPSLPPLPVPDLTRTQQHTPSAATGPSAPGGAGVTGPAASTALVHANNTIHPPPRPITTVHPPLPPYQSRQHYNNPSSGATFPSSYQQPHLLASSAPAHQGLYSHPPPLVNPYSTPQIGNLDLDSTSFSSPLHEAYTPYSNYASLPPPPSSLHRSSSFSTHTPGQTSYILYPYHPYASATMRAKIEEPILMPGELPAPRPSASYAALIGEALLTAPAPHQLYVAEISDMIKRKYAYYRQNPSKVYNGVRHQTSMCPAFVKLHRASHGNKTSGAHKWAIRSGYESFFYSGGYHPPSTPVVTPNKSRSASTGKAKSTANIKGLAIGITSPDDFRGKMQLHEPFSPSTGQGGPSLGPAYDGTSKATWYMTEDSEDEGMLSSPDQPFTPAPLFHNPHAIQLPPPHGHPGYIQHPPPAPFTTVHPPQQPQSGSQLSSSLPAGYYYVPISHSNSAQHSQQPMHPSHGFSQSMGYGALPPSQRFWYNSPAMPYQQPSYGSYPGSAPGSSAGPSHYAAGTSNSHINNNMMASPSPATQYIPTPIAPAHTQLQNVQYGSSPESEHTFAPQSFGSSYDTSQLYQYGQTQDEDVKPWPLPMPPRAPAYMQIGSPPSPRGLMPMHSSPIA